MTPDQERPPAQPEYILRGHQSQIHSLAFYCHNTRLLSADADGYIISWDTIIKRPVAGWQAHSKAVLGVAAWDDESIISHGRDNRLVVWQLDAQTEKAMQHYVPADQPQTTSAKPSLLHELTVNTMNFCPFAYCEAPIDMAFAGASTIEDGAGQQQRKPILVAVPNTVDSESIDIFYMPAAKRKSTIEAPKDVTTGMAMALLISAEKGLTTAVGYESGDVIVYQHDPRDDQWQARYRARPHSQPILSLCLHPELQACISSSADGILAKHPFASADLLQSNTSRPVKLVDTKHSGQQGLSMRNDGRIFSTAGWDSRVRVYSAKTMKELAVLKYHRQGCYETALADVLAPNGAIVGAVRTNDGNSVTESACDESTILVPKDEKQAAVMDNYQREVQSKHWLAAGSKDGSISLWNIF